LCDVYWVGTFWCWEVESHFSSLWSYKTNWRSDLYQRWNVWRSSQIQESYGICTTRRYYASSVCSKFFLFFLCYWFDLFTVCLMFVNWLKFLFSFHYQFDC
jgi:hypothetical protein